MAPRIHTVTATNYLPMALTMAQSLKRHVSDARVCILVADATPALLAQIREMHGTLAEFIGCDDLGQDALITSMREHYDVLEFCSACKVLSLDYHLRLRNEKECWFIDPDMWVLGDFTTATIALNKDIVLTYHTLAPFPDDGALPNERELAVAGAVNGGFVYMRKSEAALCALEWLIGKIKMQWFVAPSYGLYADQQWLSFLLQLFAENTGVLTDRGVNIAYWNLHERPLNEHNGLLYAKSDIATLFHFSGFAKEGAFISRHSKRLYDETTQAVLVRLLTEYRAALNGQPTNFRGDIAFVQETTQARMRRAGVQYSRLHPPVGRLTRYVQKIETLLRGVA